MARGCGFGPCCGKPQGETVRYARDKKCKRCKAFSAPSTPRGTREWVPKSRARRKSRSGCFSGPVSTHSKYRDGKRNINPRALPIVLHPDHKPRKVIPVHVCQSPRRGCTDHRCHKERGWCTIS